MILLLVALIFGIVVLLLLVRNMSGTFKGQLHGTKAERIRAFLKVILLIEVLLYIAVFVAVIVKTLIL